MINLIDLLKTKGVSFDNYKIHLATGVDHPPLDAFIEGTFKEWQEGQNQKNFQCDFVLSLISIEGDNWLFAGVYKILGVSKGISQPYLYQTELLPNQDDLIGKVIVRYKRTSRASYIWGHKFSKFLEVYEVRPNRLSIEQFPGYNNVIVRQGKLKIVVSQQEPTWKAALSNVKGIYLIVDTNTGKKYVGSATGDGGLWQRWESYVKTGHGGNIELKTLLKEKGLNYAVNFQFSILEIADSHATNEYITRREIYWKNTLLSREFGYNAN
jgi:hypothetical protein